MARFRTLLRMTAVRLSMIYALVFGLFAVALIAYTTLNTTRLLQQQTRQTIDEEILDLSRIYRHGSMSRLIRVIEQRARAPGASLYLISDTSGRIIAGNVLDIEPGILSKTGWTKQPFPYQGFGQPEGPTRYAIARVFKLPGGLRALIGRDLGEPNRFRSIARRSLILALAGMVLLGILTWFFVGRRALKRIDSVSGSTSRIMAGDLQERLPLSGSGDEFDRLSENLNQLLGRISKLDEGLKQVSDNIAHDLKTPLTRLRNKAEQTLAANPTKNSYRQAMEDIIAESDTLIRTFNALLMIARVEAGSRTGNFVKFDLTSVLQDVHELYEPLAEEAGVEFEISAGEPVEINGNRELIGQAIANLVDNAIKYSVEGGEKPHKISLRAILDDENIRVMVTDNGTGIPQEDRERVKDRFVRLDKSRTKPGTGLGLSLVDAVARLHEGMLTLRDANPGLVADLRIPVAKENK